MTHFMRLTGVSKWYGQVIGLNDVTLDIGPGVTGLLGPNGAGKTTLIRLVTGQAAPNLGTVEVLGETAFNNPRALARLGCCPDVEVVDDELSGFEFLRCLAYLHSMSAAAARARAEHLLDFVGLADAAGRPLGSYSKGMRQRAKLAQALLNDPDVLVLDEPLNGMDPVARRETTDLVRKLGDDGRCVLVSSHILHEVEAMTDVVILIHHGKVLAEGKVHEIRSLLKGYPHHISVEVDRPDEFARRLVPSDHLVAIRFAGDQVTVETTDPEQLLRSVEAMVLDDGMEVRRLRSRDDSLEAVFDYLVN